MPVAAVGSTTLRIVRHFGMPSAYDASRSSSGTRRSISSVARTISGIISMTRASDTSQPALLPPSVTMNTA